MTLPLQPNLIGLPMAPAQCVVDPVQQTAVTHAVTTVPVDHNSVPDFVANYKSWIQSTKLNAVVGLDNFNDTVFSAGTSEAFNNFYLRNSTKTFRCFQGEYIYHQKVWESCNLDWKYLDSSNGLTEITANDAVVVSLPFADTGNTHPLYRQLLDECSKKNVPVLVDCAFFGACADLDFDFSHPAVSEVVFSLSKTFPVSTLRIGARFSRYCIVDGLSIYNQTQYVNKLSAAVGLDLISKWSPDYTWQRYREQQVAFCSQLNLYPSSTVLFGLDHHHRYDKYNRGYPESNRLCFSLYFNSTEVPVA